MSKIKVEIALIGVGNTLLGDEGVGVEAVLRMMQKGLPEGVKAIPAGIYLDWILDALRDAGKVVIVDAVMAGGEPGDTYLFRAEDLLMKGSRKALPVSMHSLGVPEMVALARISGNSPEVIIAGVEPACFDPGKGLSAEVEKGLPGLIAEIDALLQKWQAGKRLPSPLAALS